MNFEKLKTPEEIQKLMKERKSSDENLLVGGAEYKGERLEITDEQFDAAKKEMKDDLGDEEEGKSQIPEEKKKEVHKKITKIEEKLGQPISEESKDMIHKNELESVKKEQGKEDSQAGKKEDHRLKQEVVELGDKQREKESSANALKEKLKSGELTDSVKKLGSVLIEREANGFNPLIDPKAIQYLMSSANELELAVADKKSSIEDINRSMKKIGGAIKAIGEVPRQIRVNDHPDSLRKVGLALQGIDQSSLEMRSKIGSLEDKNTAETLHLLRSLESLTKDKWVEVAKKRNAIEGRR